MPIIKAILEMKLEKIIEILVENPAMIDSVDRSGVPATLLAAQMGNLEIMRYIVEYSRASMNLVDQDERGILHYAAMTDAIELVQYLVEKVNMDPLEGDKNQITPFEIAHNLKCKNVEAYFEKVIGCTLDQMYKNPIITGTHPDPSIVRVGEDYYMVNSSFTYFPCIPISHSKDLVNWQIIGHAITEPEYAKLEGLESGRGYWAPDISFNKNQFYITATYRFNDTGTVYRKQIIVHSQHPEGPYSKPNEILEDGIDPSIFHDDDGRHYMLLNRGARILELDERVERQISKAELLWYGSQKRAPEGPHILKKEGFYYLFVAEGGTGIGHRISVSRAKQLMGPYESCPYNPIMIQRNPNAAIQRVGHGKPVQTQNGEWYMVYLCSRRVLNAYSILGRETALDPISWTTDGWPIVNTLKGPSSLQIRPKLKAYMPNREGNGIYVTRQNGERILDFNWMWVKTPDSHAYEPTPEDGIRLYGSPYDLHDILGRNILVRRQKAFTFTISTKMNYYCPYVGQEAGMTCYYDENTFLTFGIKHLEEGYMLQVIEQIGEDKRVTLSKILPIDRNLSEPFDIRLRIDTDYLKRSFYYGFNEEANNCLGVLAQVNYLCDEGYNKGKRFTGAMIGFYAVIAQKEERGYAEFSNVQLINY